MSNAAAFRLGAPENKSRIGRPRQRVVLSGDTKWCPKCSQWLDQSRFCKDKKAKTGLRAYCRECAYDPEQKKRTRERWQELRRCVLEHYSVGDAKCSCCAEREIAFLVLDHVNDDGAAHRAAIKQNVYTWLRANGYPPGFQVLCHNCNFAKSHNPQGCPHQLNNGPEVSHH